ncbi:conserved hypothetical protein [Talaromyces stipitatus ATCC 10500]|uniref:Cyclin-D1-binding protein 1-like N-terminal domain-containing protein n=1 Tax=Talaromyces stipitatus (strain ATCC 10500 / CBS 375.48 / QM 6759 / NRRL 1006) TaxID=441959 RepID=B8MA09_TALSN|nr:uncharacterized protein TSTA_120820 [Talaromyces stipitatus ATCC 10500]EED18338.1 conserved hypothetical protein [Talaromyces stipitatus ATCC 10500]
MSQKLHALLNTAIILSEQFQTTLDTTPPTTSEDAPTITTTEGPADPTKSLRAQVTKLSLLAITSPFTPSAISTCLVSVNDSVMPSMVTAALLLTPGEYTKAFSTEARILVKTGLKEFAALVREITDVANKFDTNNEEKKELSKSEKDVITSQTGRVWDVCDSISTLVVNGVVGHVAKRVQEWHDLVKDAIDELEEWDPEDEDGGFEELMGSDDDDESTTKIGEDEDGDQDEGMEALRNQKKSLLRALKPISQIYPAIITHRLKKGGLTTSDKTQIGKLETLTSNLQSVPDHVDEAAGSLYEHNLDDCIRFLGLAKVTADKAIELVVTPWSTSEEDKFTVWSKTWRKVMGDVISDVRP